MSLREGVFTAGYPVRMPLPGKGESNTKPVSGRVRSHRACNCPVWPNRFQADTVCARRWRMVEINCIPSFSSRLHSSVEVAILRSDLKM